MRTLLGRLAATLLALGLMGDLAAAQSKITVAVGGGACLCYLPTVLAKQLGEFEKAGLAVDLVDLKGGSDALKAVLGGSADVVSGYFDHCVNLAAKKQALQSFVVYDRYPGLVLVVAPSHANEIKSIKDLAGKKVAFTSPKSVTDMLLTMVSDKHGIKSETVAAGGIGAGLTMVEQKAVVAAPVMDPIWSKVQAKFKPVFFAKDELPPMVQTVGVTTSDYAKANKDKLRKLVQARAKAVAFLYANPEETARIVAKHYETDEKTILAAVNNLIAMKYWSDGAFEYDAMDHMVKGLQIIGEVDGKVEWSKVVDESYVK